MRCLVIISALMLLVASTCQAFTGWAIRPAAAGRIRSKAPATTQLIDSMITMAAQLQQNEGSEGASGLANLKSWDPSAQQAFVQPALHNKNPVRIAAILAASAVAARGSLLVPGNLAKFVHVLGYAAWMGSTMWVTFVAGITMMRNLPRQTFGKLQSKLFPAYFQLNFSAIAAIFIVRGCPLRTRGGITLLASLFSTLLNLVLLEPRSTDIMLKRYKLEDEDKKDTDEYKELGAKFGAFHGASSLANLGALIGAFVYAWDLASMLPV